ncbi:MAG: hypothetical protein ED554_09465 [Synechococcus sp. YX04-3]|nr:MAG: hypothetical protein ED554_09465 [Synechococcus sp. YX04-3]
MSGRPQLVLPCLAQFSCLGSATNQGPPRATTGVFGSKFSGSNAANSDSTSMVTIPMFSEDGCKAEGERWLRRPSRFRKGFREYFCVVLR